MFLFPNRETEYMNIQLPQRQRKVIEADQLIKDDELKKMIDAAKHPRDKAVISFLADTGARSKELTFIQLKHISDEETHMEVRLPKSKTKAGIRTVYLRVACGYIRDWLNIHPKNNDPNAYLFCSLKKPYRKLVAGRIWKIVKKIVREAGLRDDIYTHLFRHTRTTEDLTMFSTEIVKKLRGWSEHSRAHEVYSHLVKKDVSKAWKQYKELIRMM